MSFELSPIRRSLDDDVVYVIDTPPPPYSEEESEEQSTQQSTLGCEAWLHLLHLLNSIQHYHRHCSSEEENEESEEENEESEEESEESDISQEKSCSFRWSATP